MEKRSRFKSEYKERKYEVGKKMTEKRMKEKMEKIKVTYGQNIEYKVKARKFIKRLTD